MTASMKRRYETLSLLRWVARISSLISILVLVMFFVGEGFDPGRVSGRQWLGLLFFPVGLITGFIIGWKYEIIGGAVSVLSLLAFYFIYGLLISGRLPRGWAFAVFALPAILFLFAGIFAETAIGRGKAAETGEQAT